MTDSDYLRFNEFMKYKTYSALFLRGW